MRRYIFTLKEHRTEQTEKNDTQWKENLVYIEVQNMIKKITSMCLIAVMILSVLIAGVSTASAYTSEGNDGNIYWTFDSSTRVLRISGTGSLATYSGEDMVGEGEAPWTFHGRDAVSLIIEEGITGLGGIKSSFAQFTSLRNVSLPNTLLSIDGASFRECTSLTSINIPDSVTMIGDSAFIFCTGLTSIDIPDSVTTIGENAFAECESLSSVTFGDSVTTIGDSAFADTGLTSVSIPDSVTSIGGGAFVGTGLTTINIPANVSNIGKNPFSFCGSLESITVNPNNTVYDSRNNCNAIIKTATNELISGCSNTNIPDDVTSIGDSAFCGTALSSIEIPSSVNSIKPEAFANCRNLQSVTIPDSVTSVGPSTIVSYQSPNVFYNSRNVTVYTYETATEVIAHCETYNVPYVIIPSPHPAVENEINTSGNSGTTQVLLDYETTTFKATVPTVLPFDVDENGNVTVATNAKVINQCNGQVDVTAVRAEAQNGWSIVANGTNFKKVPVDSKQFTMTLNGDNFPAGTESNLTLGSAWTTIDGNANMALPYSGDFAVQSSPINGARVANVIFTVAWHTA